MCIRDRARTWQDERLTVLTVLTMARGVASSAEEEGGGEPVSQSVPGRVADFSAQSFL